MSGRGYGSLHVEIQVNKGNIRWDRYHDFLFYLRRTSAVRWTKSWSLAGSDWIWEAMEGRVTKENGVDGTWK